MTSKDRIKKLDLLSPHEASVFSKWISDREEISKQLDTAKAIQEDLISAVSIQKVIRISYQKGVGTKENPVRIINSYWDMKGNHLFDFEE